MQKTMQKYSSVFKTEELLNTGFHKIKKLLDKKINVNDKSFIWNTDLIEALELQNMLDFGLCNNWCKFI